MTQTIAPAAQTVIDHFTHLTIGSHAVQCPYVNNRRKGVRAALRVSIGKGSPKEIEEEALVAALKAKIDLAALSAEDAKKFLVEKNLGIDCSGFAYYVLDALVQEKKKTHLKTILHYPFAKSLIRKLVTKVRPAENTNVKVLAHDTNSKKISLAQIQVGDLITMVGTGYTGVLDHVLLITKIEMTPTGEKKLTYTHSLQWSIDGRFNHGVRTGTITIVAPSKGLVEQKWLEQGIGNEDKNGTFRRAKSATSLEIRRLRALE